MLNLLLVSLLVASAAGVPRSRGEPLHRSLQAQSGGTIQYNQNAAVPQTHAVHMVPVSLSRNEQLPAAPQSQDTGATFQVNPNTLQIQQVAQPGQQTYQVVPQPPFQNPTVHRIVPPSTAGIINPGIGGSLFPIDGVVHNPPPHVSPPLPPPPSPPSNEIVKRLIGNPPGGALLVGTNPPIFPIEKRLISNYTKLRPIVKDTFRCAKSNQPNYVGYGYYADVDNDCQIFHVCLPWKELYPKTFDSDVTYQFSFICPNQTVFSQDVLTCTWRSEAFPCADSPHLYWMNDNFFRKVNRDDGFGMRIRYAHVNEKLEHPLKYDYDDFNP